MREGWVETTLGEVLDPVATKAGTEPYELVLSVTEKRGIIPQTEVFKNRIATDDVSKYKVLLPGDISFNPYLLWCGAIGQWQGNEPGVVSPVYECFRVRQPYEPRFLGLIFESGQLTPYFNSTAIGSIERRRRTTVPVFSAAPVLLPPPAEQRRIVDVIESVDAYIAALEKRAEAARTARSALLHDLLTARSAAWPVRRFGDLLEIERGSSPRPIGAFLTDAADGTNWIKIGDASASTKYIYETDKKITLDGFATPRFVKPGDFILSNSMSFGRPYIMRTTGCIHDGWMLLTEVDRNFDEDFLYNLLQSNEIQQKFVSLAAGSGVRNLKIDSVKSIEVRVPPLAEQVAIAQTMNSFDELSLRADTALESARSLRSSLLSDLLSGNHEIPASYDELLGAA